MPACHILGWITAGPNESLVVSRAGFYSEGVETITHTLHNEVPVEIARFCGGTYAIALDYALDFARAQIIKDRFWKRTTVYGRVLKLALNEHERQRTLAVGLGRDVES